MNEETRRYIENTIMKVVNEKLSEKEDKFDLIYQEFNNFLSERYD